MGESSTSADIEGKVVFAQQGREIGVVLGLDIDISAFQVLSIEIKLKREVLEDLRLKTPLMGTQTIHLPVEHVSAIGDTVVLDKTVDQLALIAETQVQGKK